MDAARQARTPDTLRRLAEDHLAYELQMFQASANLIPLPVVQRNVPLRNVSIESVAIHTRTLLKFFFDQKPFPSDAVASDFFEGEDLWDKTRRKIADQETVDAILKRVNKEIAHLTYDRLDVALEEKGWGEIIKQTSKIFVEAFAEFVRLADGARFGPKLLESIKQFNDWLR